MFRRAKPTAGIDLARTRRYLPDNPTIVEAGAADGADAETLSRLYPTGHVHAFEPVPDTYTQLERRVGKLANVTCWNLALGATDGERVMHVSSGPYEALSSSLLTPKDHLREMPDVLFDTDITVHQQTLQSWAAGNNIAKVDLLALDMQGLEHHVLTASPDLVQQAAVIVTEVFPNEKYEGNATVLDMQRLLADLGFVVLETNMFWHNSGDVLAVNRRWFE